MLSGSEIDMPVCGDYCAVEPVLNTGAAVDIGLS